MDNDPKEAGGYVEGYLFIFPNRRSHLDDIFEGLREISIADMMSIAISGF